MLETLESPQCMNTKQGHHIFVFLNKFQQNDAPDIFKYGPVGLDDLRGIFQL